MRSHRADCSQQRYLSSPGKGNNKPRDVERDDCGFLLRQNLKGRIPCCCANSNKSSFDFPGVRIQIGRNPTRGQFRHSGPIQARGNGFRREKTDRYDRAS
jgi:hypothetical protein